MITDNEPMIAGEGAAVAREYPALVTRIKSSFIDLLVIILLMGGVSFVLDRFEHVPDWVTIALFIGVWAAYEPVCTSIGSTIGNYLMGVRVRRVSDNSRRINVFAAIARYAFKTALGWLSFLTIHSNKERRAIHDFVAGSVMVKV